MRLYVCLFSNNANGNRVFKPLFFTLNTCCIAFYFFIVSASENNKMFYKRLYGLVLLVGCSFLVTAQNTTGGITGRIQSNTGEALPGATVKLIHDPTGSAYFTQSRRKSMF